MSLSEAADHLEAAEATILSWWQRIDALDENDDEVELAFSGMLAAVLRSVSRAAGHVESAIQDQQGQP